MKKNGEEDSDRSRYLDAFDSVEWVILNKSREEAVKRGWEELWESMKKSL